MTARRDIVNERLTAALAQSAAEGVEWVDADDLIQILIPIVPPGKALRTYRMRAEREHKGGPLTRAPNSEEEQQASGARMILNDRLAKAERYGRIEVDRTGGVRRLRLRTPEETGRCPHCSRPFRTTTPPPRPASPSHPAAGTPAPSPPWPTVIYLDQRRRRNRPA